MKTFKVTYERNYPGADNDIREAYVLAESFVDAQRKVEKLEKGDYESAYVLKIEQIEAKIIV